MNQASLRWLLGSLFGALLLSGCAMFGNEDATASEPVAGELAAVRSTVRVASGDRFVDIEPTSLFDDSGALTADAMDTLREGVNRLSVNTAGPQNAGVSFDGAQFVVDPSIPGSTPDIEALAEQIADPSLVTIELPFAEVPAVVGDDQAGEFASQLNERLANGLDVSIGRQIGTLPTSILGRSTTVELIDGEWAVSVNYDGIASRLNAMFPDVGVEGGEATFDIEPGVDGEPGTVVIVPGALGTACCDEASIERIITAMTTELDPANLRLDVVDGPRGNAWAEDLGITDLVGSFTTDYTAGQSRNINIERIAELTQGTIIEPGQTWSLNESVGERTIEKGFVPAGTIINGHLTDSVGGGISQFATTIFNAAFFAGLEYDAYSAHSIYFSRYPYGREATISWPAPQLEIFNPTPHGILIWPTTTSNSVTVDLYSTEWADAEQTGQFESPVQEACTRVTTERTRTFLDGTVDVDSVFAIYRDEGIGCDGEPTDDPDAPPEPEEEESEEGDSEGPDPEDENADEDAPRNPGRNGDRNNKPDDDAQGAENQSPETENPEDEGNADGEAPEDEVAEEIEETEENGDEGGDDNGRRRPADDDQNDEQDEPEAPGEPETPAEEPTDDEAPEAETEPDQSTEQEQPADLDQPTEQEQPAEEEQSSELDQPSEADPPNDIQPDEQPVEPESASVENEGPAPEEIAAPAPTDGALDTSE